MFIVKCKKGALRYTFQAIDYAVNEEERSMNITSPAGEPGQAKSMLLQTTGSKAIDLIEVFLGQDLIEVLGPQPSAPPLAGRPHPLSRSKPKRHK